MKLAKLLEFSPRATRQLYSARDAMLYALGVGASDRSGEIAYVYEAALRVLPTMAVVIATPGFWLDEAEFEIDWRSVLHIGQALSLHRDLPPEGDVTSKLTVEAVYDKAGKGTMLHTRRELSDTHSGEAIADLRQTYLLRGDRDSGAMPAPRTAPSPIPDRPGDERVTLPTSPDQALLYRLSGDFNPLHVDPKVASAAGFSRPILHGLCTYGVAGRAVLQSIVRRTGSSLSRFDTRFASPVYPGETLRTDIWWQDGGSGFFRTHAVEREIVVLDQGYFECR
ncbi:MaoC/PaaZ C-terminal domain-containing protein [Sphingobium sp.]|uniref:MaoC/PaaZ C-terminal domain-containing protein n=1 Tax=Sphingobium sp. TaxID=1912891 RepID=UPI0028BE1F47|nr:MaoC/PaaZ C-terminal domain-containing protein [Sphingobium sp.]